MPVVLEELIDLSVHRHLLESFSRAVGIPVAVLDLHGKILIGAGWKRICTHFHRVNKTSLEKCLESDTVHANRLKKGEKYSFYYCKNGLIDAASPVFLEGEHVANAFVGQFLTSPPDIERFREQAKEYGFDEEQYLEALSEVSIISEDKAESVVEFLVTYAELVGNMALGHKRQLESEHRIKQIAEEIMEISVPAIQIWQGILAVPLIGTLDSQRTNRFVEILLKKIVETQSSVVLLDITGVPAVDTQVAQHLYETVRAARLLGSKVIVTGIRPAIAQTIVNLGIDMSEISTFSSLEHGVGKAFRILGLSPPQKRDISGKG